MVEIGYTLSSEEFPPNDLVRFAAIAEDHGFTFATISDHYHPWVTSQGQSPFAWATLGGVARATDRLRVGTAVTCPIMRIHPAIIAQAAATVADMFEGRFFLGLGAGEQLNEHVTGEPWPQPMVRQEMLREAIEIIRELWTGEEVNHFGDYFTVDEARLFTLPAQPPEIYVAASGPQAAELAAENDGLITTSPSKELVEAFEAAGGAGKARLGQLTICYDESEARAKEIAHRTWPISGLTGNFQWEIKTVEQFDEMVKMVTPEMVAKSIVCGPDPGKVHDQLQQFADAKFTHVVIHNVGPNQEQFMEWAAREILPQFQQQPQAAGIGTQERQLGR
ncbi:MAG: TIGR03557 family F420-dependent LLM class oxidoreductase [Dehalococcoidia bacterium]|nr:TIGR03557 family F420-dependent LLM class oxidoreductase [Dehalococcoidia bacterium]